MNKFLKISENWYFWFAVSFGFKIREVDEDMSLHGSYQYFIIKIVLDFILQMLFEKDKYIETSQS